MKLFIAFVVFKLLVDGVILALVIDARHEQREKEKINQEEKQLAARLQEGIDKYNSEAKSLEKLYRERKRMYNPCNYGGHDWKGDGETVVKNVCGDCKHYYNYVCNRCVKKKTTTKKDILDAIERHKGQVAPAEEDSGVIAGYRMAHDHITEIINRCIPTVDAVEVLRCKDCKYCDRGTDEDGKTFLKCLGWMYGGKKPNDFCSYAKRRDNGNA